ncbi:Serine protease easter [Frankliniella fusca]|uniref:Serine protease easter n=1 Tax=Frankliniella fusca TaxID=407009 RepID=A0AAE1HJ91_9NEOP|nr:Serine protease easter [Frankliniella fusca]
MGVLPRRTAGREAMGPAGLLLTLVEVLSVTATVASTTVRPPAPRFALGHPSSSHSRWWPVPGMAAPHESDKKEEREARSGSQAAGILTRAVPSWSAAVTLWLNPQPPGAAAGAPTGPARTSPAPAAMDTNLDDEEDPPVSFPPTPEWTPGRASRWSGGGDSPERADLGAEGRPAPGAGPARNGRSQRVDHGDTDAPPVDSDAPGWRLMDVTRCGLSRGAVSDRIVGGVVAALGQFPWLARIGYNLEGVPRRVYRCAGAVITHFHVLTAAHCVKNLPDNFEFAGVRLGEWDTATDPDCQNTVCAPPVYDVDPESVIVHQDYNNPRFANDIALVKLAQKINFNGWVAPVCVPYGELLSRSYEWERTEVAGWGIYDIGLQRSSQELRTVHLPVVSNSICHALYRNQANITKRQLCAGGELGFDACSGDSGGPLLKVEAYNGGPRYFIVGIVSFGSKRCGLTPTPGVYTRVSYYVDWILDNIG